MGRNYFFFQLKKVSKFLMTYIGYDRDIMYSIIVEQTRLPVIRVFILTKSISSPSRWF